MHFISLLTLTLIFLLIPSPNSAQRTNNGPVENAIEEIRSREFLSAEDILISMGNYTGSIPHIVKSVYANSEQNTNLILGFSNVTRKLELSFILLTSLWTEMKHNNHRNPYHLMALYKNFENQICATSVKPNCGRLKPTLDEIKLANEMSVGEILKSYMLANNFRNNPQVRELTDAVFEFDKYVSTDKIMIQLVNQTFSRIPSVTIADNIMYGCSKLPQIISGLLLLFMKVNDQNDPATLRIAFYISKIKKMDGYGEISLKYKYVMNTLIDKLPISGRSLYLNRELCIVSIGKGEYLVAADEQFYHNTRRAVFTANIDQLGSNGTWRAVINNDGSIHLRNLAYRNEFLYASTYEKYDRSSRIIQTWEGKELDSQIGISWSIELVDEYCLIKNDFFNEYLFASDIQGGPNNNRLVFSTRQEASYRDNPDFLWQIQDCF